MRYVIASTENCPTCGMSHPPHDLVRRAGPVSSDLLYDAHQAAEAAFEAVMEDERDGGCACTTCIVREVLLAAWPLLRIEAGRELAAQVHGLVQTSDLREEMATFFRDLGHLVKPYLAEGGGR